jgi:hypothetical protein
MFLPKEIICKINKNLDVETFCNILQIFNPTNFEIYQFLRNKTIFNGKYYEDIDYKSVLLLIQRGDLYTKFLKSLHYQNRITGNGEEIFIKPHCKGHHPCICQK